MSNKHLAEQISNTLEIIESLDLRKKKDKAILLNSLLSLVILPVEEIKKNNKQRLFEGSFTDMLKKTGICPLLFQPIKTCDGSKISYEKKTIYSFIRVFRNSIAHQNISFSDDGNKISFCNKCTMKGCKHCSTKICAKKGIVFRGNGVNDFVIEMSYLQLRKTARYIAKSYKKACDK